MGEAPTSDHYYSTVAWDIGLTFDNGKHGKSCLSALGCCSCLRMHFLSINKDVARAAQHGRLSASDSIEFCMSYVFYS